MKFKRLLNDSVDSSDIKINQSKITTDSFNMSFFMADKYDKKSEIIFTTGEIEIDANEELLELREQIRKLAWENDHFAIDEFLEKIGPSFGEEILIEKFMEIYLKFRNDLEEAYRNWEKNSINKLKKYVNGD